MSVTLIFKMSQSIIQIIDGKKEQDRHRDTLREDNIMLRETEEEQSCIVLFFHLLCKVSKREQLSRGVLNKNIN